MSKFESLDPVLTISSRLQTNLSQRNRAPTLRASALLLVRFAYLGVGLGYTGGTGHAGKVFGFEIISYHRR